MPRAKLICQKRKIAGCRIVPGFCRSGHKFALFIVDVITCTEILVKVQFILAWDLYLDFYCKSHENL